MDWHQEDLGIVGGRLGGGNGEYVGWISDARRANRSLEIHRERWR